MSSFGSTSHGQAGHGSKADADRAHAPDPAPGDESGNPNEIAKGIQGYLLGLAFAVVLTIVSFLLPTTHLVWAPGVPMALVVFAIAQMGVHLAFFLHITTGPDHTNNVMALAFGVLIVFLVMAGSLFIMGHLNERMMPMGELMLMQR